MRALVVGILVFVFTLTLWVFWQAFVFLTHGPAVGPGEEKIFEVLPGQGFYSVAERLEKEGFTTSAFRFKILAKVSGQESGLRVGEYALKTDMRPMDVLEVLSSGKSIEHKITFPEGTNIFEMAAAVEQKGLAKAADFLALVRDPRLIEELLGEKLPSLEGYLFPETYKYTKYTPVQSLVKGMVARFKETYGKIVYDPNVKLSRHQLVTLASVIEKETGAPEERPLISSVFHNRLNRHIRLQSDPTIIYGIWIETGSYKQNITRDDITRPTLYNTYTVPALPLGPIANPGSEALMAAAQPATSPFLFFVSKNDGTHTFSENLGQHNAAVQKFQMDQKARTGKSWRDLKARGDTKSPASPRMGTATVAKPTSAAKSGGRGSAKNSPSNTRSQNRKKVGP